MDGPRAKQPMADAFLRPRGRRDLGTEYYYFLLGFLATLAVLYPYAGQAFRWFGYHPRVIASGLLAFVALLSLLRFSLHKARNSLLILCVALMVIAFVYADWVQRDFAFQVQFDTEYYSGKLARFYQICFPLVVLGYLVSGSRHQVAFMRGTWWSIFVCGLIGLYVFTWRRGEFLGQTFAMVHSFGGGFSTIALSIVLGLAAVLLVEKAPWKGWDFAWLPALALAEFFALLLLRQRAHLIMLAVFVLARFWAARVKLLSLIAVTILFAVGVALVVKHYREYVIPETVRLYWAAAADGLMVETRLGLFREAWEGIREYPWGQGLGSFSFDHYNKYPHNCVLEAFYEMGIFGGLCVSAMCVVACCHFFMLFARPKDSGPDPPTWFLHAAVVFLLGHMLKANPLEDIGVFVYFLFIAPDLSLWGKAPSRLRTVNGRAHASRPGRSTRPRWPRPKAPLAGPQHAGNLA